MLLREDLNAFDTSMDNALKAVDVLKYRVQYTSKSLIKDKGKNGSMYLRDSEYSKLKEKLNDTQNYFVNTLFQKDMIIKCLQEQLQQTMNDVTRKEEELREIKTSNEEKDSKLKEKDSNIKDLVSSLVKSTNKLKENDMVIEKLETAIKTNQKNLEEEECNAVLFKTSLKETQQVYMKTSGKLQKANKELNSRSKMIYKIQQSFHQNRSELNLTKQKLARMIEISKAYDEKTKLLEKDNNSKLAKIKSLQLQVFQKHERMEDLYQKLQQSQQSEAMLVHKLNLSRQQVAALSNSVSLLTEEFEKHEQLGGNQKSNDVQIKGS